MLRGLLPINSNSCQIESYWELIPVCESENLRLDNNMSFHLSLGCSIICYYKQLCTRISNF